MRDLPYLSPTSLSKFYEDPIEFYLTYLAESRAPRFPQTQPMSIGSAFDAYAKSYLHEALYGKGNDPKFAFEALFEAQVEEHNRDWARVHGKHAFECYRDTGCLADLMVELHASIGDPKFELEVKGVINGYREGVTKNVENVCFLGKPDVFYLNKEGCHVIFDFKVNGWCSNHGVSPHRGYLRVRTAGATPIVGAHHKDCHPLMHRGSTINAMMYLEDVNKSWADQLSIYGWLCGCEVGEDFIVAVDQFACRPSGETFPRVRIAEHRLRVNPDYQWSLFARAQTAWEVIHSDHIFRELSKEESREKCHLLDKQAADLANPQTPEDALFNKMTRV